jgi:DNA-directed RNA polymerase subunit RPC12/RpoP
MKALHLHCHCGSRILTRDVVERNWYVRVYGPNFMYVKYRCSHCRRVGEKLIEQDRWDDSILREIPHETTPEERRRLKTLKAITLEEQLEVHAALDDPAVLKGLKRSA